MASANALAEEVESNTLGTRRGTGSECIRRNILQVWGLASTSPALSGFFTSLASLWVPTLAFVWFRLPVARATWAGMVLGIAGLAILGIHRGASWGMSVGDGLTVLSSFAFALFILSLDRLGRTVNSSHLTIVGCASFATATLTPTSASSTRLFWQSSNA